jgi:hypothetical protein
VRKVQPSAQGRQRRKWWIINSTKWKARCRPGTFSVPKLGVRGKLSHRPSFKSTASGLAWRRCSTHPPHDDTLLGAKGRKGLGLDYQDLPFKLPTCPDTSTRTWSNVTVVVNKNQQSASKKKPPPQMQMRRPARVRLMHVRIMA